MALKILPRSGNSHYFAKIHQDSLNEVAFNVATVTDLYSNILRFHSATLSGYK